MKLRARDSPSLKLILFDTTVTVGLGESQPWYVPVGYSEDRPSVGQLPKLLVFSLSGDLLQVSHLGRNAPSNTSCRKCDQAEKIVFE